MGIFDRLTARLELYRLEQKYARRRNRTTFSSGGAVYVDGEYRYPEQGQSHLQQSQSPSSTGSGSSANSSPVTQQRNDLGQHGRGVMSAGLGVNGSHRNSRIWGGGQR